MKKLILTMAAIIALVGVLFSPMTVMAITTTVITGQVGDTPIVTSVDPNHASTGPIPVTITGDNFIIGQPATVVVSGSDVTVGAVTVVSTTSITTTFIITSAAAQGARNVLVTVAGKTGTGTSVFTVDGWITINAPEGFSLGLMTVGVAKEVASGTPGTSASNYGTWTVTAKDANEVVNKGKMLLNVDPFTPLNNKLKIGSEAVPTLDADTGFSYTAMTTSLPLYASQIVAGGDVAGTYTITITFTSSGS
jgi:hypothetical protein